MNNLMQPFLFPELVELEPPTYEEDPCFWCCGRCYKSNSYCEDCKKETKPDWNDIAVRERYDNLQAYRKGRS